MLDLETDDFEAIDNDIKAWCRQTGNRLMDQERVGRIRRYAIEKGPPRRSDHGLALILGSAGLEQLLSPLGFALGAALVGTHVSIYFQGPAVRVLARGFSEKLPGLNRPFSRFARQGLAKIGHLPPQEKLRQLQALGASFYACGPSMEHFGVRKEDLVFEATIAEYLTFLEVMADSDQQLVF